ncbi:hypothetical protein ACMD2_26841 [Ananas comosus]|uniref:PB1 domain-containing protein n=1 Tax=Ananas comosus TaxID=4615 RepID=A0A199VM24_ANACO|nr:hypothetical protein ACMD2_26841 [Ananas comosus]
METGGYPDSVESSPRSRGGESWDEPFAYAPASAAAPSRLRLMCSYGGRIVPRPTDKSLCYLGGETRIVVVDRHSSLADLQAKLSRSLLGGRPFSLKYQLPNEDLDSLISVSTDEDLDNMIDEYDRIVSSAASSSGGAAAAGGGGGGGGSTRSSRLRLFLFPAKAESTPSSSMGSLLDDSSKSETWFVDALNSAIGALDDLPRGVSADSASVNCLLGLEDDSSVHSRHTAAAAPSAAAPADALPRPDSSGKLARHGGQDVQSGPDSPMLDKNSSFGSTSSAPSLSNLPPIRVRPDDRPPDHIASQGQLQQQQRPDEGYAPTHLPPQIPLPAAPGSTPTISPTENPNRVGVFSSDDEKSDHGGIRRPLQPPIQPKPAPLDAIGSDLSARRGLLPAS